MIKITTWVLLASSPPFAVQSLILNEKVSSRRAFFFESVSSAAAALTAVTWPGTARAVPPLSKADEGRIHKQMAAVQPPTTLPRQQLALDFAVSLTRSSYVETDQLDIIPVNQLERDMYQVRTTEYEPYAQRTGFFIQGDLTNPKYFDYMSAVQYLIINRAIQDPDTDFDELQPVQGDPDSESYDPKWETVHVHRSVPVQDLVSTHDARVGASILDYVRDTYDGTPIALPKFSTSPRPSLDEVEQSLAQLVKLFLINGFGWEGEVEKRSNKSATTGTFVLTLDAPATLWSATCLQRAKLPLRNDFLLKTAKQLVQSMGYAVESSRVKLQGNQEISTLTIS